MELSSQIAKCAISAQRKWILFYKSIIGISLAYSAERFLEAPRNNECKICHVDSTQNKQKVNFF